MNDRFLLHVCCAPCACYSVDFLRQKGFDITGFWFNPNIHPFTEYERRRLTLEEYRAKAGLDVVFDCEVGVGTWLERTRQGWSSGDKERRCGLCYKIRLERTVAEAKKRGFGGFSTTLLYSRYQFHDDIVAICRELEKSHGVRFVYFDLRQGWQKGIEISKAMGLYRQKYCGCLFSEEEGKKKG